MERTYVISWETVERHTLTVTESELATMARASVAEVAACTDPIRTSLALVGDMTDVTDGIAAREGEETYRATLDRCVTRIERYAYP